MTFQTSERPKKIFKKKSSAQRPADGTTNWAAATAS